MTMPGIRSARRGRSRTCGRRLCPRARWGGAARLARDREPATCFVSFCAKARKLGGAEMRPDTDAIPAPVEDIDTSPAAAVGQNLIVDAMPANLIALESILESLGRPIKTARSGEEALGLLLDHEFALVLLDVNMPGMDGYETIRWIRSRERTKHLPVIFVTAEDRASAEIARAYALGAVDFLFKPVRAEILRAMSAMFVSLQERTEQRSAERLERDFVSRRRDHEALSLRRERDRELVAKHELTRLNEALAENDRRKDSFLAILAHALRHPLAPNQSYDEQNRRA